MYFPIPHIIYLYTIILGCFTMQAQQPHDYQFDKDSLVHKIYEHKNKSQYDSALAGINTLIREAEKYQNTNDIATGYNLYALTNIFWVKTDSPLDKAQEIHTQNGDALKIAETYLHKAISSLFFNEIETSLQYIVKAEKLVAEINQLEQLQKLEFTKGLYYKYTGDYLLSIKHFEEADKITYTYENDYIKTVIQNNLAEANLYLGNMQAAQMHVDQGKKYADTYGFENQIVEYQKIIAEIAHYNDQPYESIKLFKEYDRIKYLQYVRMNPNIDKISDYKFQMDIQSKEISNLTNLTNKLRKQQILTNTSLIFAVFLLAALCLFILKQRKTNKKLAHANQTITTSKEEVVKAANAKSDFLSTVSHELRTPLYAVTGITSMLIKDNPLERQKENLQTLKASGEFLLQLINDILNLNALDKNKIQYNYVTFNLKKEIKSIIDTLTIRARDKGNTILLDFDKNIHANIKCDPIKFSQVMVNLIGNAIKFTKNGIITVRFTLLDNNADKQQLQIAVSDTGIGIPKEKQEMIFQHFNQGSVHINRNFGGTGLGLAIVKKILDLKNTTIHIDSDLGLGSKFYYNIWLDKSLNAEENQEHDKSYYDYSHLKGLRVLLVDDNKVNQLISGRILKDREIEYDLANNGYEAIDLAIANSYDLILMDVLMPELNGTEATKKIRDFDTKIPIVALTAIAIDQSAEELYKAGFDDIIMKPFKPEYLYDKISEKMLIKERQKVL